MVYVWYIRSIRYYFKTGRTLCSLIFCGDQTVSRFYAFQAFDNSCQLCCRGAGYIPICVIHVGLRGRATPGNLACYPTFPWNKLFQFYAWTPDPSTSKKLGFFLDFVYDPSNALLESDEKLGRVKARLCLLQVIAISPIQLFSLTLCVLATYCI